MLSKGFRFALLPVLAVLACLVGVRAAIAEGISEVEVEAYQLSVMSS